MRDIVVTIMILGALPFAMAKTHLAVVLWSWIGYMNPHRLAFGFAHTMPFAQIVAGATFFSLLINRERKRIPITAITVVWILYIVWMIISTLSAVDFDSSWAQLTKVLKIQLFMFIAMMVMINKERINMLVWTIALSIGFFGIKGGIFTILTGGGERVWGPPGSFIEDNNALAVATIMTVPLIYYLYLHATRWWVRWGLMGAAGLSVISAIGSYSRGAVISITCAALFFWFKSRKKLVSAVIVLTLAPAIILFMPQKWFDRLSTMGSGQADSMEIAQMQTRDNTGTVSPPIPERDWFGYWPRDFSALGRVNAWNYAINIANARLTGGGLESWSPGTFALYAPVVEEVKAAHSIYFSVLADHGWPGFIMFLSILAMAWRAGSYTISASAGRPELLWAHDLARMIHVSLITYCTGGAFLSLSYYDLPWNLIAFNVLLKQIVQEHVRAESSLQEPANASPAPGGSEPGQSRRPGAPFGGVPTTT